MAAWQSVRGTAAGVAAILALAAAGTYAGWRGTRLVRAELSTMDTGRVVTGLGLIALAIVLLTTGAAVLRTLQARARYPGRMYSPWSAAYLRYVFTSSAPVTVSAVAAALGVAWWRHGHAEPAQAAGIVAVTPTVAVMLRHTWDWIRWRRGPAPAWIGPVHLVVFEAGAVGLAVTAADRGDPGAAWFFGATAALPALPAVLSYLVATVVTRDQPAAPVPVAAQLAGLAVPVASLATAGYLRPGTSLADSPATWAGGLGALALAAGLLLALQQTFVRWLNPDPPRLGTDDRPYVLNSARTYARRLTERPEEGFRPSTDDIRIGWRPHGRPALNARVARIQRDTLWRTGLLVNEVWPGIESVLPAEIHRGLRGVTRSITALRVMAASALTTAVAWAVTATGWFGPVAGPATTLTAIGGPLLVAVVLTTQLRGRVADRYEQRARLVDVHRFALMQQMRLRIPSSPEGFRDAAPVLMAWAEADGFETRPDPRERDVVAAEVRKALVPAIRQLEERLAARVENGLAYQAGRAEAVGRWVQPDVPDLVDFDGFLAVDTPEHTFGGPAGGTLDLSLHVGRGPGAGFAVREQIRITGGRTDDRVEFDTVADSPTLRLTPAQHRLTVTRHGSATFTAHLPEAPGEHEVWFQLYQAGRLIQALVVHVEVRPTTAPVTG